MTSSLLVFQTCFPVIVHYVLLVADVMIGVLFTLGSLAVRITNTNIYLLSNKYKPGKRPALTPDLHPDVCFTEEYSEHIEAKTMQKFMNIILLILTSVWPVNDCRT